MEEKRRKKREKEDSSVNAKRSEVVIQPKLLMNAPKKAPAEFAKIRANVAEPVEETLTTKI